MRFILLIASTIVLCSNMNSQIIFDNNLLLDKNGKNGVAFNLKIVGLRKVKKNVESDNLDSLITLNSRKAFNPINRYYINQSEKQLFFELKPQYHKTYYYDFLIIENNALHLEYSDQNGTKKSIIVKNSDLNNFAVVIKETNIKGKTKTYFSTNSIFEKKF